MFPSTELDCVSIFSLGWPELPTHVRSPAHLPMSVTGKGGNKKRGGKKKPNFRRKNSLNGRWESEEILPFSFTNAKVSLELAYCIHRAGWISLAISIAMRVDISRRADIHQTGLQDEIIDSPHPVVEFPRAFQEFQRIVIDSS